MANYNFYLYDSKAVKETPVYLYIRYSRNTVRYYTRESIHPEFWDPETQRAKLTRKFKEFPEFNVRLDNIMATAKTIFRKFQNDHDNQEPSPAELKRLLGSIKGNKSGPPSGLFEFYEYFIEQTRRQLISEKKNIVNRNSRLSCYGQNLTALKDFSKDKNRRIDFDTIDEDFYNDFIKYLETPQKKINRKGKLVDKYGFCLNTVGKQIANLKHMLNVASDEGINRFTTYKKFKVLREEVSAIYLNEDELQALFELDLSDCLRLDKVRDLFLVGCWTGLRFSDFTNIAARDIRGDFIHMETQKTGERVVIPIHWTVKSIMKKYETDNNLPPDISNPKMNKYLKELGGKLDRLAVSTDTSRTKAGMKILSQKKKYDLISTHTARRSFATNMFKKGVPTITIMRVTGHRTEKAFMKYIKCTPDEHAKIMMRYFQLRAI